MQRTRLLCCAAAAGGSVGPANVTKKGTDAGKVVDGEARVRATDKNPNASSSGEGLDATLQPFSRLHFQPWQVLSIGTADRRALLPREVLYHGERLGPRPLMILDHSVRSKTPVEMTTAARKYESILSSMSWRFGAVYIPLDISMDEPDVMQRSCEQVCAVMDALDVRWTHFLTYSYGTLVAARMAASTAYPNRMGSFISIDTPLVTAEWVRNMKRREEIAQAEEDINVPAGELAFAKEELIQSLERPLPCPASADTELYEKHLFDPGVVFEEQGLIRREERYIPLRHLGEMHHPFQLIVPVAEPVTDVAVHRDYFNLRRPAVIKTAASHSELFAPRAAKEVAATVNAWVQRFELDVSLKRRYEQSANEMSQLMSSAQSTSATPTSVPAAGKRKKKDQKG